MFWRRKQRERDLEREIRADLELEAAERQSSGLSEEEARLAARRAFGNSTFVKEDVRAMWGFAFPSQLAQDLRYALRTIRSNRAFSAAAILSLALGIGANTAIFSLMDALLMRFLPVRNPGELVQLMLVERGRPGESFGYPSIGALASRTDIFAGVCGFSSYSFNVASNVASREATERVPGAWVTGAFYRTLGVEPFAGRLLTPDDDRPGAPAVAVLSYAYWKNRFGGDFGVIGRSIEIENQQVPIVGISPSGFDGANVGSAANLTLALAALPRLFPERDRMLESSAQWLRMLARPQPGISIAQAKARLAVVWPQMAAVATAPRMNAKRRQGLLASSIDLVPGGAGYSGLRSQFRRPLYVLLAITALVLLIACANFANLLLARGTARAKEIALRFAIGAGRARVIRQLLTESLLLSAAGAALGLGLAAVAGRLLLTILSTGGFDPIALDLHPDARVLFFATSIALATGILFGLAPAMRATAAGPAAALKGGSGISPRTRSRLLPALVVSQVALSLVLLIGAGLFVRTFQNLLERDPGFRSEGVLVVELDARRAGYNDNHLAALYEDILDKFQQLPGVVSASISVNTPLNGVTWTDPIAINGQMTTETVHLNLAGPRYFETMGTPLVLGRDFGQGDHAGAPATAIVNEAFVRKYLSDGGSGGNPGLSPLGQRLTITTPASATAAIVGVVASTVARNLREDAQPFVYLPYFQYGDQITSGTFEIRAQGSLARTAALVSEQLRARFSGTPAQIREQTLSEQVGRTLVQERALAALGSCFGVLALVLAAVGLYGLLAYMVARSTNEIGIRMALGARRAEVVGLVLRGALRLLAFGILLGVPVAWAGSRWIGSMLFGLRGTDPLTASIAAAILAATGLSAALLPAWRAARIDPLAALRHE
jgi:predicted permease